MTPERIWRFPLVVLAVSSREVGFVAATGPMRVDAARSWIVRKVAPGTRRQFVEARVLEAVAKFDPETVLVTHGTQWSVDEATKKACLDSAMNLRLEVAFLDLGEACDLIGCDRRLHSAAERVTDWFPRFARRLRPALAGRPDRGALRDIRPLLSALTVAHAASVAHVIKFG